MPMRFMGKRPYKKYVRPIRNNAVKHVETETVVEETVVSMPKAAEVIIEKENDTKVEETPNEIKSNSEDETMDKLEKVESIVSSSKDKRRRVKVEKKDKGLYERTTESTILLTEDNKMLLND